MSENRAANKIKKNSQDTLKTVGQSSFINPTLRVLSFENHKLKFCKIINQEDGNW